MYGFSVGVAHVGETLPQPVYALLSGLNAATVGIIALAAVRLAGKVITDKLTRFLVYLSAILGMLYTAPWYYPVIIAVAGLGTILWDLRWLHRSCASLRRFIPRPTFRRKMPLKDREKDEYMRKHGSSLNIHLSKPLPHPPPAYHDHRSSMPYIEPATPVPVPYLERHASVPIPPPPSPTSFITAPEPSSPAPSDPARQDVSSMSWKTGTAIITLFLLTFILTLILHATTTPHTRPFSLFSSLYLAGTIIVGGGPVVIPLLREYIVTPGWVSTRDFLLAVAIQQALPGPNFNIVVYLGSLAVAGTSVPSYLGAMVAFVAMYAPGVFIVVGFMGLWRVLEGRKWFPAVLRGVSAGAVGLVCTKPSFLLDD